MVGSVYRLNYLLLRMVPACLAICCLAGCSGGGGVPDDPVAPPGDTTGTGAAAPAVIEVTMQPQAAVEPGFRTTSLVNPALLSLDLPAPRTVSEADALIIVDAAGYDPGLLNRNVEARGGYALFQPDWTGGDAADLDRAAFCAYNIDVTGYAGLPTLSIVWSEKAFPVTQAEYWCGIANYARDRWDFFKGPLDQVITLESVAPYTSPGGRMVVMPVMLSACRVAVLESVKLGVAETRAAGLIEGEVTFNYTDPALYTGSLPVAIDLSAQCAPVGDQLTWGSCSAFALANGAYNHVLGLIYGEAGWDLADPAFQASPKFQYVESGKDPGHTATAYSGRVMELVAAGLCDYGVATELNAPYDMVYDDDWSAAALADAEVLHTEESVAIPLADPTAFAVIKYMLAGRNQTVFLSLNLDQSFSNLAPGTTWTYAGPTTVRHSMLIVGYDDSRQAFRVRNSWGTDWCDAGYCWVSYPTLLLPGAYAKAGYVIEEYSPAVSTRFLGAPSATPPPTCFQASRGTVAGAVHLSWEAPAAAGSFRVYRDDRTLPVATVTAREWDDTGLTDALGHTYWVRAEYPGGTSDLSAPATGYLKTSAAQITNITPLNCGHHQLVTFEPVIAGQAVLSYLWEFGPAGTPATSLEETPTILTGPAGSYTVRLTITDALGSDTEVFPLEIGDNTAPSCDFTLEPEIVYPAQPVTFDAGACSDPDGRIVLYEWDWEGDGTYDTATLEPVATHAYSNHPAQLDPVLRVTDDGGLTATSPGHVQVLDYDNAPIVSFALRSDDGTWQPPATVMLDASATFDYEDDIALYQWDVDGDGSFDLNVTEPSVEHLFTDHCAGEISLRVTDQAGLWAESAQPLRIGLGAPVPGWSVHGIAVVDYAAGLSLDLESGSGLPAVLVVDTAGGLHFLESTCVPGHHSDWDETVLTGTGPVTGSAGLALTATGRALVSCYSDQPQPGLYFAGREPGYAWEYSTVVMDGTSHPGTVNDIATVAGLPAIAFSWADTEPVSARGMYYAGAVTYPVAGPGDWEIVQVGEEDQPTAPLSLAEVNGRPAFVYSSGSNTSAAAWYACQDPAAPVGENPWDVHTIDPGNLAPPVAGLVGLGNRPLVCCGLGEEPAALRLVRGKIGEPQEPIDWYFMTGEATAAPVLDSDLDLVSGIPWAAWAADSTPATLRVSWSNDASPSDDGDWTTAAVCSGDYCGLCITAVAGQPALVFYCTGDGWLYYAAPAP